MKKQYVLDEQEYLSLCNKLENIEASFSIIWAIGELRKGDFQKGQQRVTEILRDLGWKE
ncbi:hypothetical protein ACFU1R_20285 [Priestia megaterium]|uniref:hypothetical protein n=1 Tax=Priestia megaterium TaxID=1404 RepID=UPI0036715A2E